MVKYLSVEQVNRSLTEAAKKGIESYLILNIFAKSGIRISELVSITPNDILADEEQLIIRGKGNKIRNVDIPSDLIMLLESYLKGKKIRKNSRIFKLTTRAIRYRVKKIAGTNPHSFRHTYAINLLRTTGNIRYVQKQLGHKTLATTQIYLQFIEYNKEKQKLGELYN